MRNKSVYFIVIAIGAVAVLATVYFKTRPGEKIEPPRVLAEQILRGETPVEKRAVAARKMIVHGTAARPEIRRVFSEYTGDDPEVIIPLIQATAKANNYRSIPRLFDLMEHCDVRIRGKAGAAVRKMLGADYGFRAADPTSKRDEKLKMLKQAFGCMERDGVLAELYD